MSATLIDTVVSSTDPDYSTFKFEMTIPIPSYLLAIAVGNLTQVQVGPRTYVISEPSNIDACANELSGLETLLDTAETYMRTLYVWGIYKILILPPSFPFGGMENPYITFASPTIIVGDKS